jgi:hypothetical protein
MLAPFLVSLLLSQIIARKNMGDHTMEVFYTHEKHVPPVILRPRVVKLLTAGKTPTFIPDILIHNFTLSSNTARHPQ